MKWVRCFLAIFVFAISPLWGQTKFVKVYRVSDSLIPAGVVPYPDRYVVVAGKEDNSPASIADTVFILTLYIETGYESSSVSRFKGSLTYRVVTEEDTSQGRSTFYYGKYGLTDEEPEKWYTFSYDGFRLKGGLRIWLGE